MLKDFDFISGHVQQIIVNRQEGQKGHENGSGAQEMPHIMIIKEV